MNRILIVDDNESIHADFRKVLQGGAKDKLRSVELELFGEDALGPAPKVHASYRLDDAFQGEQAIKMVDIAAAENDPYALVFMDVRMPPGMDGIKAAGEIWQRHPEVEMVICTAHSDYSWSEMLTQIGVSDKLQFVRKPFDMVSIQQLALSLTKKWELQRQTQATIERLEIEVQQRELAEGKLRALNEDLESRIEARTHEIQQKNEALQDALGHLREAQEHMVASEKMAALGGLVAGIAHEINTPVGIGVTATSHLTQKTNDLLEAYQNKTMKRSDLHSFLQTAREATHMIMSNLNRASELIQSFKQVAVDQSSETRRTFQVREYLEEVILSLRPNLKKTHIEVAVTCDPALSLDSYPGAFGQIISNLTMNAVLHGIGAQASGRIRIDVTPDGDGIILVFEDNGRGIPQDHLKKIFDPFFTTKRGEGGSGLGLHIVYNIVTQTLGGTIQCESVPDAFTRFTLRLPFSPQPGGPHGRNQPI
ncbi:hybrid sensor histidine kinase/response regulator [Acanthopleuribacter pedis]|uniref:histidine kinase n=1 Tax=Acanthopleuribacter pedis TaxID=442870 RepID=A0A8J7Q3Y3_9BACT|nr:ATP-binding protein [Acanthopleuribacter pedis]MBO1318795.1 response regulator [Acanthopleuribacter pedis]